MSLLKEGNTLDSIYNTDTKNDSGLVKNNLMKKISSSCDDNLKDGELLDELKNRKSSVQNSTGIYYGTCKVKGQNNGSLAFTEEKIKIMNSEIYSKENIIDFNLDTSNCDEEEIRNASSIRKEQINYKQNNLANTQAFEDSKIPGLIKDTFNNSSRVKKEMIHVKKDLEEMQEQLGSYITI